MALNPPSPNTLNQKKQNKSHHHVFDKSILLTLFCFCLCIVLASIRPCGAFTFWATTWTSYIKMHLSLQELALFGTQEVVLDLGKMGRRLRICQGPRSMCPRSFGPVDKGTNLADLSSTSTGKCSDLRIILRRNWQPQPRHDNPLQARPVARFLTFPIGLPHKSEGTLKRPQPIAQPSNRRRCWKWPAVAPDNGRLIDCFLNFHCHKTIS